jgi:hypothetical protein
MYNTLSAYTPTPTTAASPPAAIPFEWSVGSKSSWGLFGAAAFLVSIPVFAQAPLVRQWPLVSLILTLGWLGLGYALHRKESTSVLGDLILGFTWSWFAGSIYWGWFRTEPFIHLPIEAIGVPFAIWAIARRRYLVGTFFYLGSLLGTAITDAYFYAMDLIPFWRQVMKVEVQEAFPILQTALHQIQNSAGALWATVLIGTLCISGLLPLVRLEVRRGDRLSFGWWVFMGAVLSTLVVDGLFWIVVCWI